MSYIGGVDAVYVGTGIMGMMVSTPRTHTTNRQTDIQTNRQIYKQTKTSINTQTNRINEQNKQINKQTELKLKKRQTNKQEKSFF